MADLTPDLQVRLSWGLVSESFHSLQSLSVSCFHVILGLPGPRFPSTCMSKAVLTAPLECSTCPYHRSLLSFRMRSRSSMPSRTSSLLDLVVTMSCGLTLQIYLIIALSFRCRHWRFGFVNGQISLAWSIALCTKKLYTRSRVLKERWREERTGSRSLICFFYIAIHNCNTYAHVSYIYIYIYIIGFLINVQVQGQHPHQWAPFQIAGLLHAWQISHQISRYVYHEGW